MPKIDLYTLAGKKMGQVNLEKEIFGAKINPQLMAQAARVYLSNQRRAKAKVKDRSEVRGSRRKIWRQKGTGRARHGDRYAPIFVGGGRAHGPTGEENYHLKMSKKMKRQAFFSALTSKLQAQQMIALKGLGKIEPKTKKIAVIIDKLKLEGKVLLVLPSPLENVMRAARNLALLSFAQASQLNTYQVLNCDHLILMEESLGKISETYLSKNKKIKPRARKSK